MTEQTSGIPRRRDYYSDWHDLVAASCEKCTCTRFVAKDDPEIIWEPGDAWEEHCTDRSCTCHVAPVLGLRRGEEA
jgi:hypothetical protein